MANDEDGAFEETGLERAVKLLAAKQERIRDLALLIAHPGDKGNIFSGIGLFISTSSDGSVIVTIKDIFPGDESAKLIYAPDGEPYSQKKNKYRLDVPRITDSNWLNAHSEMQGGEWSTMYYFTPSGSSKKLTQHPIIVSGDLSDFNLFPQRNRFRVEESELLDGELELPGFVLDTILSRLMGITGTPKDTGA